MLHYIFFCCRENYYSQSFKAYYVDCINKYNRVLIYIFIGVDYMSSKKNLEKHDWGTLVIIILTIEGLVFIASLFNKGAGRYYELLRKPIFALPPVILSIIWPLVFLVISIALYLFLLNGKVKENIKNPLFSFIVQVFLNLMWPFIFFRLNLYGISFIFSLLVILTAILTTIGFFKKHKVSAILMLPYITILLYSSILNYYIWLLNEA